MRRTLPFIPINDTTAFASFVVLSDTELVSACAPEMARRIGAVDAIVTALGGSTDIASTLGQGTTVSITLPVYHPGQEHLHEPI